MFKLILVLCVLTVAYAATMPGKAVFWSANGALVHNSETSHVTKSITGSHISDFISKNNKNYEAMAVLQFGTGSAAQVNEAFRNSKSKIAFLNVYQNSASPSASTIGDHLGISQKMSMKEFQEKCKSSDMMTNGKMDVVEVSVDNAADIAALAHENVLLATYQEPTSVAPATSRPSSSRLLSSSVTDGVFYKPEGAEYSIYFADTYLYITPDIFTGLMTGLFFFFTVLIGVTCLGSIQGMSTFYDKVPAVGKEA